MASQGSLMFPVEFSNRFVLNPWGMNVTLCLWSLTWRTLLIIRKTDISLCSTLPSRTTCKVMKGKRPVHGEHGLRTNLFSDCDGRMLTQAPITPKWRLPILRNHVASLPLHSPSYPHPHLWPRFPVWQLAFILYDPDVASSGKSSSLPAE